MQPLSRMRIDPNWRCDVSDILSQASVTFVPDVSQKNNTPIPAQARSQAHTTGVVFFRDVWDNGRGSRRVTLGQAVTSETKVTGVVAWGMSRTTHFQQAY
jgi:hypothetical protein